MLGRHTAERPHRVLKPGTETLEALRKTERHVLPVRMRQHEVVDQMRERLAVDRHAQLAHVREVRGAQPARQVLLREVDLLVRPARGLPVLDPPLQRPQLPIVELTGMTPLQLLEERPGFPAICRFEQFFHFTPHLDERIGTRPIRTWQRLRRPPRRQHVRMPILPCRLAIHARLRRRKRQRRLLAQPLPQHPYLSIRNHRDTPSGRRNAQQPISFVEIRKHRQTGQSRSSAGKCSCRRGVLVVVHQLPKSKIGEAFTYASNQWPTLTRYVDDLRLNIDNNPAEQAMRPSAVGRKNWLHIGGDGGLARGAVLLSLAASAKQHHVNPWEYVKDLLTEIPTRALIADLSDLLPDAWAKAHPAT